MINLIEIFQSSKCKGLVAENKSDELFTQKFEPFSVDLTFTKIVCESLNWHQIWLDALKRHGLDGIYGLPDIQCKAVVSGPYKVFIITMPGELESFYILDRAMKNFS